MPVSSMRRMLRPRSLGVSILEVGGAPDQHLDSASVPAAVSFTRPPRSRSSSGDAGSRADHGGVRRRRSTFSFAVRGCSACSTPFCPPARQHPELFQTAAVRSHIPSAFLPLRTASRFIRRSGRRFAAFAAAGGALFALSQVSRCGRRQQLHLASASALLRPPVFACATSSRLFRCLLRLFRPLRVACAARPLSASAASHHRFFAAAAAAAAAFDLDRVRREGVARLVLLSSSGRSGRRRRARAEGWRYRRRGPSCVRSARRLFFGAGGALRQRLYRCFEDFHEDDRVHGREPRWPGGGRARGRSAGPRPSVAAGRNGRRSPPT